MKNGKVVLVAIEVFDQAGKGLIEELRRDGFEVRQNTTGHHLDYKKDASLFQGVDFVIAGLEKYDAEFFTRFPQVKAISRIGVGVDAIDVKTALSQGVKIFKTSDKPSVAVAELCISNAIALLRHTHQMSETLKSNGWKPHQGKELRSCTVGIVGLGSIGKEVARRLKVFGCKLIGTGRTWDTDFAEEFGIERVGLDELMKLSDIVTIHLPFSPETAGMISRGHIESMRQGAVLINTSRSGVLDNEAVCDALKKGQLAGAAIDVFSEHRSIKPYDGAQNVILTPHIGSHTIETRQAMESMAVDSLLKQHKLEGQCSDQEAREIFDYLSKHTVK